MSRSFLPDFELRDLPLVVDMGVKKRVNRRGVIEGAFLGLLLVMLDGGGPIGDDGIICSWS